MDELSVGHSGVQGEILGDAEREKNERRVKRE